MQVDTGSVAAAELICTTGGEEDVHLCLVTVIIMMVALATRERMATLHKEAGKGQAHSRRHDKHCQEQSLKTFHVYKCVVFVLMTWLSLRWTQVSLRIFHVCKPSGKNSTSTESCSVLPTTNLVNDSQCQKRTKNNLASPIVIISHCFDFSFCFRSVRPNPCNLKVKCRFLDLTKVKVRGCYK